MVNIVATYTHMIQISLKIVWTKMAFLHKNSSKNTWKLKNQERVKKKASGNKA